MIYQVTLQGDPINEIVVTAADNEQHAIEIATYSAVQRMLKAGTATVEVIEMPPESAA